MKNQLVAINIILFFTLLAHATGASKVLVQGGQFAPLFGLDKDQKSFEVKSFEIDKYPVTVKQFSAFLNKNKNWQKGQVPDLFADENYLKNWSQEKNKVQLPKNQNSPVVYVSWFAANAYCEAQGGRLPTVLEWEYVGAADEKKANAMRDKEFVDKIIEWYSRPSLEANQLSIGKMKPNFYGVHDMHALVWEWTSDFNSVFVSGDNRADGDKNKNFFCGSGVTGASNREDYAAFMRYAMRNSLNANFSTANLGFRCAYDVNNKR